VSGSESDSPADFMAIEGDYRIIVKRPWLRFTSCFLGAEFDILHSPTTWNFWSCNINYQNAGIRNVRGFCTSFDGFGAARIPI